ncbi:MAG: lysophospholipid acyltransferase family protein [Rhodobacteraceae bacterium]|jgi:KDO2-lipid IV(A) lauroyltransferase|nr:lysophospholipid acyltransferase family protein [Paracoccaceae bacterium]
MPDTGPSTTDRVTDAAARGLIRLGRLLPYRRRIPAMGWLTSRVLAPLTGWNRRVRENLAFVLPGLSEAETRALCREATGNGGRLIIETYSGDEMSAAVGEVPITGPGAEALLAACASDHAVLIVSGHFGNYEAISVALKQRGHDMGVLYRPMKNTLFNDHYVKALGAYAAPPIATDRRGITQVVRILRDGGTIGILIDLRNAAGAPLQFMGQTAMTSTSAAEWALKYDALLVPAYGIRQPDGIAFEVFVDTPVDHTGDPAAMTQALNDSLERQVRARPGQWFWMHRRWGRPGARP